MKPDMPQFETKKEMFTWLKENEGDIISFKKAQFKTADCFTAPVNTICHNIQTLSKDFMSQDEVLTAKGTLEEGTIKVRVAINTTMIRDSHKDVHINGLWKKSLKENRRIKHLQEHEMKFDKIIADRDDLKAFTKTYEWKQLGYDIEGKTEALVFDSTIRQSRNKTMFNEYKNENVDNHSVGMFYVNLKLAFDSDEEGDEKYKEEYDKHIEQIANKAEVKKDGYFYAIYEAKAIEGSAVPIGSNQITPTLTTSKSEFRNEVDSKEKAIKDWLSK